MIQDVLKKYNTNIEELDKEEFDVFVKMLNVAEKKQLTIEKIKSSIQDLIRIVQKDIVDTPEVEYYFFGLFSRESRKSVTLRARLKNYILIENIITTPERAKRMLDEAMENLKLSQEMGL